MSVSPFRTRLPATSSVLALAAALVFSRFAIAAGLGADSTWSPAGVLPEQLDSPVLALAVNPADSRSVLAGTASGSIYRSADGGASWSPARRGAGHRVIALSFSPSKPGLVLAGLRAEGVARSLDGGATWAPAGGVDRVSVRSFAFTKSALVAGTDRGVYTSKDGTAWSASGLGQLSVDALAVAAVNDPARVLAGADATTAAEVLPVYQTADGGATWAALPAPPSASNIVAALAAGPQPSAAGVRPVVMGTNAGLYSSTDNGSTWTQLTGGGLLPAVDFTALAWSSKPDRFYVGSDGGGSRQGGLWVTGDGGQHFRSLEPPLGSVSAITVSADEVPIVYVATFRPADHAVAIWSYRDTGATPTPPPAGQATPAAAAVVAVAPAAGTAGDRWLAVLLTGPEGPYLVVGVAAVLVLILALIAYARRRTS